MRLFITLLLAIPLSSIAADINIGQLYFGDDTVVTEIRAVPDGEDIHLHIDSPGGNASTMKQIIMEMEISNHTFIAHVRKAQSAAFLIAVKADEIVCYFNPFVMTHVPRIMFGGNLTASNTEGMHEHLVRTQEYTMKVVKPLLTPAELDMVENDLDVYLRCEELKRRIKWPEKLYLTPPQ